MVRTAPYSILNALGLFIFDMRNDDGSGHLLNFVDFAQSSRAFKIYRISRNKVAEVIYASKPSALL